MNQKLWFLCFQGINNSLQSFWTKWGYSRKNWPSFSVLYSLQFKTGVHLLKVELTQLPSLSTANGHSISLGPVCWPLSKVHCAFVKDFLKAKPGCPRLLPSVKETKISDKLHEWSCMSTRVSRTSIILQNNIFSQFHSAPVLYTVGF